MQCLQLTRGKASVLDDNFANNSWDAIVAACQSGSVPDSWAVGDSKTMTIGGTDYQIDIIGKNHDTYASGGKAPLTFQMHNCNISYSMNGSYDDEYSATNELGWAGCEMRNTRLPSILALMPSEVQAGIKEVDKLTSAGNQSGTINTTADKLFLLSEVEIFGSVTYSKSGEGSQYAYYSAGNSKVKYDPEYGNEISWWERSPYSDNSTCFCYVNEKGGADFNESNYNMSVAFGFCF